MRHDHSGPVSASAVDVVRHRGPAPSRSDIEAQLGAEGLSPHTWGNEAGATYGRHMHEFHKVLVCVSGTIIFHIQAGDVELGPGDRMELPPGVKHAATVGDSGVECVEAPRR